jgi:hypothetical protein
MTLVVDILKYHDQSSTKLPKGNQKSHVLVYNQRVAIQFSWSSNMLIGIFKQGCCRIVHLVRKLNENDFFE